MLKYEEGIVQDYKNEDIVTDHETVKILSTHEFPVLPRTSLVTFVNSPVRPTDPSAAEPDQVLTPTALRYLSIYPTAPLAVAFTGSIKLSA